MTLGLLGVESADVLEKTLKEERKRYYKDGMWLGVEARMGPNSVVSPRNRRLRPAELSETTSLEFLNGTWFHLKIDCLSMEESGEI